MTKSFLLPAACRLLLATCCILPALSFAQDTINYKLKKGDILLYDVVDTANAANSYKLTLTLTSVPEGALDFTKLTYDWIKIGSSIKQGSSVFSEYVELTSTLSLEYDATEFSNAVWLSQMAAASIMLGSFEVSLFNDITPTKFNLDGTYIAKGFGYNGKECKLRINQFISATNKGDKLWVLDSDANPLVVNMQLPSRNLKVKLLSIGNINTPVTPQKAAVEETKPAQQAPRNDR